jgi:folate-binding protein YgfZ
MRLAVVGRGGTPTDPSIFDAFRIDAGFPIHGVDVSEDNLAQEAGRTEQAISFRKGCYLGQEPIARLDALGHVNRVLRVIAFAHGSSPVRGDKVVDRDSRAELGTLSSVGRLAASAVMGMAVLRTSASPGSRVIALTGSGEVDGTVVPTDADHPSAA